MMLLNLDIVDFEEDVLINFDGIFLFLEINIIEHKEIFFRHVAIKRDVDGNEFYAPSCSFKRYTNEGINQYRFKDCAYMLKIRE